MVEAFELPLASAEFWRWTMMAVLMLAVGLLIRHARPDFAAGKFFAIGGGFGLAGMAWIALTGNVVWS